MGRKTYKSFINSTLRGGLSYPEGGVNADKFTTRIVASDQARK